MRSETMPTPEQIEEQVKLEREAISCGLKRLQDQTIKLEDQSYASATIYGISSIDTLLPLLVQRIEKTRLRIHKGSNGAFFKEIHSQLAGIDTPIAAVIACKLTFDKVFSYKEKANQAVNVCDAIGRKKSSSSLILSLA